MMKIQKKLVLLSSAAVALYASQAAAQSAAGSTAAAPSQGGGSNQLAEIVVTAQKQSLNLQKASAAITAIQGDVLVARGVSDLRAAQMFIPSVRFQDQQAATEIYFRGVGSSQDWPNIDPPASFNFNGIYVPREATSVPFYDIAQLEALPGPQGTLYGRSSLGGVVNVNFKRPTFEHETSALLEAGNYGLFHGSVAENIPVSGSLAVRGAVDYTRHDGYLKSGADSADTFAARLSLLWKPTSDFSAYIWGSYATKNGNPTNLVGKSVNAAGAFVPNSYLNSDPWNDLLPPSVLATSPFGQVHPGMQYYENKMFGGQFDWNIGDDVTLTYIPSYLRLDAKVGYFLNGLPGYKEDHFKQHTHELRAAGTEGWGNWLVGLYGYQMTSSGRGQAGALDRTGFFVNMVDFNRLEGLAGFGQVTYNLTDALRLIAGGRFSEDRRVGRGPFFNGATFTLESYSAKHKYSHFDYKAGVEYDVAPRVMLYGTVQTGYQPGTYNTFPSTPALSNLVQPAKLTAYTVGEKGRFLDGALQFNSEFFYYDYRDLFASAFNLRLLTTQTFNAQKVRIYGNQTDIIYRPTSDDQFNLSVGYLHARNVKFVLPGGAANFNGLQVQVAPDWTLSAGYYHDFQLSSGYVRALVNTHYESSFFADYAHTPGGYQKSYHKTDLSLTYYAPNNQWSVGLWAKNIENTAAVAAMAAGSFFPSNPLAAAAYLEPPRTYGIRATLHY